MLNGLGNYSLIVNPTIFKYSKSHKIFSVLLGIRSLNFQTWVRRLFLKPSLNLFFERWNCVIKQSRHTFYFDYFLNPSIKGILGAKGNLLIILTRGRRFKSKDFSRVSKFFLKQSVSNANDKNQKFRRFHLTMKRQKIKKCMKV